MELGRISAVIGASNSGKTELLRDLLRLTVNLDLRKSEADTPNEAELPLILRDLEFQSHLTPDELMRGLPGIGERPQESKVLSGLGPMLNGPKLLNVQPEVWSILQRPTLLASTTQRSRLAELLQLRVAYSDVMTRKESLQATAACSPSDTHANLLQALHFAAPEIHAELDASYFEITRSLHIKLDDTKRVQLALRVAEQFPESSTDPCEAIREMEMIPGIEQQSEGHQAIVAIVLGMLLGQGRLHLLNDPAVFLDPLLARRLGQWIARNAERLNCQVIVATDSEAFLAGLFSGNEDVSVIRTQRDRVSSRCDYFSTSDIASLYKSPFFSEHELVGILFTGRAIVLQDATEATFYKTIALRQDGEVTVSFVNAHGRQNISFMAKLLRDVGIPICVVADWSSLDSRNNLESLVKSVTGELPLQAWYSTRDKLEQQIGCRWSRASLSIASREVEDFLDRMSDENGLETPSRPNGALKSDESVLDWEMLCQVGIDAVNDDFRPWLEQLFDELQEVGIFIVPIGQLQGWLDFGADMSKPDWFFNAMSELEMSECPTNLELFVSRMIDYLITRQAAPSNPF